jgi:hypothetical protein
MVLKQLDNGKYTFWCPGCNDLHVIGDEYTVVGPFERPTISPAVYEWDEHITCHVSIYRGKLKFLPATNHELSEQTVPMCPVPVWMEDEPETVEEEVEEDGFYYPTTDEASFEDEDYEEEDLHPSLWLDGRKHG